MKSYHASFMGRHKGAIGSFELLSDIVQAEDPIAAKAALYEKWDSAHSIVLSEVYVPADPIGDEQG
jgi:hypothetical protein